MILTGRQILAAKTEGQIRIDPWCDAQLNPNSYNLRLGEDLAIYTERELDMARPHGIEFLKIPPEGLLLQPGTLQGFRPGDEMPIGAQRPRRLLYRNRQASRRQNPCRSLVAALRCTLHHDPPGRGPLDDGPGHRCARSRLGMRRRPPDR